MKPIKPLFLLGLATALSFLATSCETVDADHDDDDDHHHHARSTTTTTIEERRVAPVQQQETHVIRSY